MLFRTAAAHGNKIFMENIFQVIMAGQSLVEVEPKKIADKEFNA